MTLEAADPAPDHADNGVTTPTWPDASAVTLGAAVLLPAILAGCGGGGGGGGGGSGPLPPALTITAIEVMAVTDTPGTPVTINGTVQPASGGVVKPLNGAVGFAPDPGAKGATSDREFEVRATGATDGIDVTVTFNPSPTDVSSLALPGFTTYAQARHLGARTGFGASWNDLVSLMGKTYDEAVDFLIDGMRTTPMQGPPGWINDTILTWTEFSALSSAAQDAYNDRKWPRRNELKQWWLREIVQTASPLTERMVAFWGNHFVVNIDDIEEPQIAWSWLSFLRTHASGNLRTFIHGMCLHPAMLLYLDNASNVKSWPPGVNTGPKKVPSNENFGRELLELFSLGERTPAGAPTYTENDVLMVARAFTGHNTSDRKGYQFKPDKHDSESDITFLGAPTQAYGGTAGNVYDIIDVIMEMRMSGGEPPRVAQLVVEKLWAEFIGTTPTAGQVNALAQVLYDNTWELKPLFKAFFKHADFKLGATDLSRKLLKMPLELVAGFYRSLEIPPDNNDWSSQVWIHSEQDQDPLAPPIVKGWLGGTTWINAKSLVSRFEHFGWFGWYLYNLGDAGLPQFLRYGYQDFMLTIPRVLPEPTIETWAPPLARRLQFIVRDPAYHMK